MIETAPNPMVQIEDFLAVIEDLCPECCKSVKRALIHRLAMKATPAPLPKTSMTRDLNDLLEAVAGDHGFTSELIRNGGNQAPLVEARREFAKQARARGYSLPVIGRAINRHHSSVVHLLENKRGGQTKP